LTATDLTLLGIGAIIGTGIFVLTGTGRRQRAGPAIVLSYVAAGVACAFAALCYAEFAAMIPISGSAYTYAYATLGEIFAWMIGWDLILEYAVGSMTVAVGWSGYFQRLLDSWFGVHLPVWMSAAPNAGVEGAVINLVAILIVLVISFVLVIGVKESAWFNAFLVTIKLAAILFFLLIGVGYIKPGNWSPFMPYGFQGVMAAGAVVFFAYIGFDAVSTTAEEAKNPSRDLPIGIILSLIICTVLYLSVAAVLSGIIPVVQYGTDAVPHGAVACAGRDQPGVSRGAPIDWCAHGHHERSPGHAAQSTPHLLFYEPRPAVATRRQQVHPRFERHHHDHHHRRHRRYRGRVHAHQHGGRDDEHRDPVRLRGRVLGGHDAARQAARRPPPVPRALRLPLPGPRCPVVPLPDAEPVGGDLGALPRLARPRDDDLLVLRQNPQSIGESGGNRRAVVDRALEIS
jgi:hypothetical protein